jgi:hypothetical protein
VLSVEHDGSVKRSRKQEASEDEKLSSVPESKVERKAMMS